MEMEKEDVLSSENLDVLKKILIDVCPSLTKRIDKFKRETSKCEKDVQDVYYIA